MKSTQIDADPKETHLGELARLYRAADPLPTLSEEEKRHMRRRVRRTLLKGPSLVRFFRLGTALAGLGLLLLGGVGYAAVQKWGIIQSIWKAKDGGTAPTLPVQEKKRRGPRSASVDKTAENQAGVPDLSLPTPAVLPAPPPALPSTLAPTVPKILPTLPKSSRPLPTAPVAHSERVAAVPSAALEHPLPAQPPAPPAPPPPLEIPTQVDSPPPTEATLLAQAMRVLRTMKDGDGALTILSEMKLRFPDGTFQMERSILEVEALLTQKREDAALRILDGLNLGDLPRSGERFVLRGELRARARRFAEAATDFDRALARVSGQPAWHERALWGRAVSRLQNKMRAEGMADLEDYLEQYPQGGHAQEASVLLGK